jgi:NitT/TauT family transport system substrate-binding protein
MPVLARSVAARFAALTIAALALAAPAASAANLKAKIAVGGASCLCYLPSVLAKQLGYYEQAGIDVELIDFKGGSTALTAVLGGSADVVSGYFDHTVNLAAKDKPMQAFVVFGSLPGEVLVVSPKSADQVKTIADLAGKQVGVSAPGSSTDFFLKYLLKKNGVDANKVSVVGVGLGASSVAAMEQGQVQAAVMLDPAVTQMQARHPGLKLLSDTRSQADTRAVFGGDYPGGSLYAPTPWLKSHANEAELLAVALLRTLNWIHSHSAEEIAAKMPAEFAAGDPKLYLAALKNSIPTYSKTGLMDPKGAAAVLDVFSEFVPEVKSAHIDIKSTYTDEFIKKAQAKVGSKS